MKSDTANPSFVGISKNQGVFKATDPNYPSCIMGCLVCPPPIYWRGNLALLKSTHILAVVGSRALTSTNQAALTSILHSITDTRLVIASGLARGLDAVAHRIALENALPTIAVLGSSVEPHEIYPRSNARLAEQIVANRGLLLSPFPPDTPVRRFNFPARNQIIAALSQAVLIASAAIQSGALITARFALDYGRDVLVIPGSIVDPLYAGSNQLLQEGAQPVLSASDITGYFKLNPPATPDYGSLPASDAALIAALRTRACTLDELSRATGLPLTTVIPAVSSFELKGWVEILSDGTIRVL